MAKALITRDLLHSIELPPGATKTKVHDTKVPGFFAEVRRSVITFYVRTRDGRGRQSDTKLGRHGVVTLEQARRKAGEIRARVSLGEDPIGEREALRAIPPLTMVGDRFLEHARENLRSHKNIPPYLRRMKQFFKLKALDEISVVDVADFRRWLMALNLSNASVNRHLATLRSAYNLAKKWGLWKGDNPAASPGMLREEHRDVYIDAEQIRALFKALDLEPNRCAAAAIALLVLTGARKSEVLQARWSLIDEARGLLTVPRSKHGAVRHIPLSPQAMMVIRTQRLRVQDGSEHVFPGVKAGCPLEDLRGPWKRAKLAAGLPAGLRIHDLRHSFASALANQGVPLNEIGTVLGHRVLQTTLRYSHHSSERLVATATRAADSWNLLPHLTVDEPVA